MTKHPVSTNVRSRSLFDGQTLAGEELARHADVVARMRAQWRRDTAAVMAAVPGIVAHAAPHLQPPLLTILSRVLADLLRAELQHHARRIDAAATTLVEIVAAETDLRTANELMQSAFRPLLAVVRDIAGVVGRLRLPPATDAQSAHQVPLIAFVRDGKRAMTDLVRAILAQQTSLLVLTRTLTSNLANATGQHPDDEARALTPPHALDGAADAVAQRVFAETPLLRLLLHPLSVAIPIETRFRHTHLVAGSGWGKTQVLQYEIARFLSQPSPPSLVIIDSQSEMLRKIERLALFAPGRGRLRDRLVIIDPTDVEHPPALNLFCLNHARLARADAAAREQILNGLVELYETISGAILGADMTPKQQLLFRFLTRLMLAIPGATIKTLIEALHDLKPFAGAIAGLNGTAREFLTRQAGARDFLATRDQILRRLYAILEQPTFERMFTASSLKLDLFDCLQTGRIVLVNTAKDFLKTERSMILGRVFAALTLQATIERAAVAKERRRPAFLIMDEAHEYLDGSTKQVLEQARKYHVGLIAAHQGLEQLSPSLKASLATNTAIKMVGGVNDADAHALAREMKTTPDAIRALERGERATTFMTYVDGLTPQALPLSFPFGALERMPVMSDSEHRQLIADNRRRISEPRRSSQPTPTRPPTAKGTTPAVPSPRPPDLPKPDDDWWS